MHNSKWVNSDNLSVQNTICTENGSTTQKAIFTKITTIPENAQVAQAGDLEPVVKQHNYVKPPISEYIGNCEGLVESQPGQNYASTQSHVYSRTRLTSERPRGHSVLAHYNRYLNVEGVHRRSLADWWTVRRGPPSSGFK